MSKKIFQFRYFGDENPENFPQVINAEKLYSGSVFDGYTPITKIGIQSIPGLRFRFNNNVDDIILGGTGLYELDLSNSSGVITAISFNQQSIDSINRNKNAYLIIDFVNEEVD